MWEKVQHELLYYCMWISENDMWVQKLDRKRKWEKVKEGEIKQQSECPTGCYRVHWKISVNTQPMQTHFLVLNGKHTPECRRVVNLPSAITHGFQQSLPRNWPTKGNVLIASLVELCFTVNKHIKIRYSQTWIINVLEHVDSN